MSRYTDASMHRDTNADDTYRDTLACVSIKKIYIYIFNFFLNGQCQTMSMILIGISTLKLLVIRV